VQYLTSTIDDTRWVSIAGGAHLIIGSRSECRNVSALGSSDGLWSQRGITIVNAVPTLINIMTSLDDESKLPSSVRLLNLGGEACPSALVDRLWHKDLRIINTYGPSETTVTATFQELIPGHVVTIGKPLPSYHALLLPIADDYEASTAPEGPILLKAGVEGELCIGGPCLGKGYVKRQELTLEKFISHPLASSTNGERLYRTGDRVRLDESLNILFLGRIDSQVKHRGFRIELGEIESALSSHPSVQTAAVILSSAKERLEAYVVTKEAVEVKALRNALSALPAYMQPEAFFFLKAEEMPRLPSGKINAKALQEMSKALSEVKQAVKQKEEIPLNIDESSTLGILLKAMSIVFPQAGQILPESDFFDDLGGHSLAAAILVSKLRKDGHSALSSIGLQDIYVCRTAQSLADKYTDQEDDDSLSDEKERLAYSLDDATGRDTGEYWPVTNRSFVLCGIAQIPALLFFCFMQSVDLLVPYLVFYAVLHSTNVGYAILATYAVFVTIPISFAIIGILGKWIVLGKARPGEYPLYGVYYYRFWLAQLFVRLIKNAEVADSPLHPLLLRLLGAKIGSHCHIGATALNAAFDLIEIGDDVVISQDVLFATNVVERGRLILKRITIESDIYIGSNSVLEGGSQVEQGVELSALTLVADGVNIPAGQHWHGSPAQYLAQSNDSGLERRTRPSQIRIIIMSIAMAFTSTFIFPIFYFAPQIPSMLLFDYVDIPSIGEYAQVAVVVLPASLCYIFAVFLEMIVFRWLILGKVQPGSHGTTSITFFRHWFVEHLMSMGLIILQPVYATLYVVPFLRCLGVKIGDWAEVSTARGIQFELTEIGDESFVADNVLMGGKKVRGNKMHLEKTTLRARAFCGNGAIIPQGTVLASNSLVGVLSIGPDSKSPLQEGQSCFGSPPVLMPARQQGQTCHAAHLLYSPRPSQIALRLVIEGLRIQGRCLFSALVLHWKQSRSTLMVELELFQFSGSCLSSTSSSLLCLL
jgi:non-ribosomal peptide synthetase-like protein